MKFSLRELILLVVGIACASGLATAQERTEDGEPKPFHELARLVQEDIAWDGEKRPLVDAFNKERTRLGPTFRAELLKFIGTNAERHYWCGVFLTNETYLEGLSKKQGLAVSLWEQGVVLLKRGTKHNSPRSALHHLLAIEYSKQGFDTLASYHKAYVNYLYEKYDAGGPALSKKDAEIYRGIKALPDVRFED